MKSKLRARTPIIALAFIGIAVLFIASCTTNEVDIPGLTGPSGARLFITIEASPDSVFIRKPNNAPGTSRITLQLKNQLGEGIPNARIKVVITNAEGTEVSIGTLDHLTVLTDSAGFARVTYTAPSTAQQPVPVQVFVRAILTDPAYAFEVVSTLRLDLELARPFDCVDGPGGPVIAFSFVPQNPAEDQEVCFDAQGTTDNGQIISFTWDFGDKKSDSGPFVCHTFTSQGFFPVTLTVIDEDQNCASLTQVVDVGEGGSPSCTFTTSPNPVNTDTTVFFDASASTDSDGNIVSFGWNFGDGSTRSGEQTTHSYSTEGSYTVTLSVRDNAGNETVCTQTVTVASGIPNCPTITIQPDPAVANEPVTFTISNPNSVDPDGGTATFAWDLDNDGFFDDGTGTVVTFTYVTDGPQIIRIQVTDDEENTVICLESVDVGEQPLPTCSFTNAPSPSCVGQNVTFTSTSTPNDTSITSFEWDFDCPIPGDSVDSTAGPITINAFGTAGTFTVCLEVTNSDGLSATCNRPQIVLDEPDIDDTTPFSPTSGAVGTPVTIFGTGFVNFAGGGRLFFGATPQPNFTVNGTGTEIQTTVPNGAIDGAIQFTSNCGGDISNVDFDVVETMTISNGVPSPALEGVAIEFTVTLSNARTVDTTVDWTTGGGNATGGAACNDLGEDYISDSDNLTIPAGATTGSIPIITCTDTDTPEVQETFNVTLSNASAGVTITDPTGVGSISDDPTP